MSEQAKQRVLCPLPMHVLAIRLSPFFLTPIVLGTLVFWLSPNSTDLGYSVCKLLNMFGGLYIAVLLTHWCIRRREKKERQEEESRHEASAHNAEV